MIMAERNSKAGKSPPTASVIRTRSPEQKRMSAKLGLSLLKERASSPALSDKPKAPAPTFEQFLEMVRKDDTAQLSDVLMQHPSLVSLRTPNNQTALHIAASEGKCGAVKVFLASAWKDQILNATNDEGWTPLMVAASCGHLVPCRLLLEAGAYAKGETRSKSTPLHHVSRWLPEKDRDTEAIVALIDLFLASGALINATNAHGLTPVYEAAQMGNHEVVRFLLKRGANPTIADKFGQTAHAVAARKGFMEVCKAFSDWELKQQEQKEKEKEKEVAASLPPLTEEEKKKLELDAHNSIRINPLTGDRRSIALGAPSRSMALTLALYAGSDRASAPSVPSVPISALAAPQPKLGPRFSSPPTSPKGVFIHHNPDEAAEATSSSLPVTGGSSILSPRRRSVNLSLAPITASLYVSPPKSIPPPPPQPASSPPLKASSPPATALPVVVDEKAALKASQSLATPTDPEHLEWIAFLVECGIPGDRAPRYATWLVKEGVEVESSRELPDDLMKVLTFSTVVAPVDLVTLYKRYWTLRGSSLK